MKIKQCKSPSSGKLIKNCDNCEFYKLQNVSYNLLNPVFSFKHLQSGYSLEKAPDAEKVALLDNLIYRSQMTWADIQYSGRHGIGIEKIERNAIKAPIPSTITEDVNLIAMRYSAKKAMVGYRDKQIFYILWVDYNFTLYKH